MEVYKVADKVADVVADIVADMVVHKKIIIGRHVVGHDDIF